MLLVPLVLENPMVPAKLRLKLGPLINYQLKLKLATYYIFKIEKYLTFMLMNSKLTHCSYFT